VENTEQYNIFDRSTFFAEMKENIRRESASISIQELRHVSGNNAKDRGLFGG